MAIQTTIKCGICLETAHEEERDTWSVLLTCGHVFHSTCLELALQSQRPSVCPFCRVSPQGQFLKYPMLCHNIMLCLSNTIQVC